MADTLLPPSATSQERAIEQTIVRSSDFYPNYVRNWVPADVPENILPWLAWAYSVDEWAASWPLDVRRDYTEQSYFIHRHKGTVGAVRRALRSVTGGDEMTLEEWFQYNGPVHTFTVTAESFDLWLRDGPPISPEFYRQIRAVVYASKPVRSHWELRVRMPSEASIGAASAVNTAAVVTGGDELRRPPIGSQSATAATGAVNTAAVVTGGDELRRPPIGSQSATAATGAVNTAAVVTAGEQMVLPATQARSGISITGAISVVAVV